MGLNKEEEYFKCYTQKVHKLGNDGGFVALKWATENREVWRLRERMSKTCCTAEYY